MGVSAKHACTHARYLPSRSRERACTLTHAHTHHSPVQNGAEQEDGDDGRGQRVDNDGEDKGDGAEEATLQLLARRALGGKDGL